MNNRKLNIKRVILEADLSSTIETKMTWYPCVYYFHMNAEDVTECLVDYAYDYCVYWKDPKS